MSSTESAARTRARNRRLFASPFGAIYDFYMRRERLNRIIGRVVWNSDIRPFYSSLARIGTVPDGATIIDAPCGSGIALRHLRPEQDVRYLGFDLSPEMLRRAEGWARKSGLSQVELTEADVESVPVADQTADLFASYFGLHCLPDPASAVTEAARCLRAEGRLVGSAIVIGTRPLDRLRVRPGTGAFGPVGTETDLRQWLTSAGLDRISTDVRGVFAYFEAEKPG